jgi:starch-binding outer membrane protein, SusD/RagB family
MKKIILLIGIIVAFASCEDVLIEEPKAIVSEQFYNSAGDLETAVNAIFSPLRSYNCLGALYPWQTEIYSDFQLGRGSYAVLNEYEGLDNTNVTRIGSMWNEFYLAIRNANLVIANAPDATEASEADIAKYTAEARFMRAFTYSLIIPYFGKLPLRTESTISDTEIPLSSEDDVYALIIDDLEYAEQNLPDAPSVAGRPTKWAAKSVLAHVHFIRENYGEARNKAEEVINSNKFSLVGVETVDDWQKLFGPTLISTPEEIFYIKYNKESGWSFIVFMHHPSDPYYNGSGLFACYMDTVKLSARWDNWDSNDLRKGLYYSWEFGLGANTMLNNKFMDTEHIGNGANDYPFYRYADILLIYAEAAGRANNGTTADAIEKLNMVHRRAYGKNPNQPSEVDFKLADFPDLQSFIDLVVMERGYETYYEGGKRWLDLLRLGKDYTKNIIMEVHGKAVADGHFLWPIPATEMDLNDAIDESDQNPGY